MPFKDIPIEQWKGFCNEFSHDHAGCSATVEICQSGTSESRTAARDMPFAGISMDDGSRRVNILLGDRGRHLAHNVDGCERIRFDDRSPSGRDIVEFEGADGSVTRVECLLHTGANAARGPVESGLPGGGKGRRDEVGKSGVYPLSHSAEASPDAPIVQPGGWGQKGRLEGYKDHGDSEISTERKRRM
ncbi:MAG: DUF5335 family protein [Acidobacteria bacterium]|nr:DUF5335 family protein [Acidobacteriota bacterium]